MTTTETIQVRHSFKDMNQLNLFIGKLTGSQKIVKEFSAGLETILIVSEKISIHTEDIWDKTFCQ